jgi:hypothetical protein
MTMSPHDELDLLSPYLDGELDASDRERLDAHVTSCAECRTTMAGLLATLADLRTLPEPAPTPQDSWALRAAIRRARSPMRRWQRVSWAAGAVAAAAIAFAALTIPGNNGSQDLASGSLNESAPSVPMFQSGANLQAVDAQALLLNVAGISTDAGAPAAQPLITAIPSGAGTETRAVEGQTSSSFSALVAEDPVRTQIDRCVEVVRKSIQEFIDPVRFDVATFESKPAFLLFFRTTDRYELWVVGRSDCSILYFAQAG